VPIPGVAWMQVIARVPLQQHAIRVRGILQQFVEVHHAVEGAARADPGIDRLPLCGAFRRIGVRCERLVFPRKKRPADDFDAAGVGAQDEWLVAAIMSSAETGSDSGAPAANRRRRSLMPRSTTTCVTVRNKAPADRTTCLGFEL
jgi:hypothetical protein